MAEIEDGWAVIGDHLQVGGDFEALRVFETPWATIAVRVDPLPAVKPSIVPPATVPDRPALPPLLPPILNPGVPPDQALVHDADQALRQVVDSGTRFELEGVGLVSFVTIERDDLEPPEPAGGEPVPAPA